MTALDELYDALSDAVAAMRRGADEPEIIRHLSPFLTSEQGLCTLAQQLARIITDSINESGRYQILVNARDAEAHDLITTFILAMGNDDTTAAEHLFHTAPMDDKLAIVAGLLRAVDGRTV